MDRLRRSNPASKDGHEMAVACPDVLVTRSLPSSVHSSRIDREEAFEATVYSVSPDRDAPVRWYALRVRPRYEKLTAMILGNKGYEYLLPLYKCRTNPHRSREFDLPIFPGYLFCQFDPSVRMPILTTPGVLHVVGYDRIPIPLDEAEMESIRRLAGSQLQAEPWPYLEIGQKVYVEKGPLQGAVGILLALKTRYRLILSVTLLKRAVAVEIDRSSVRPAETRTGGGRQPS
jgi:transcription antitermination factor NusG